MISLVKSSGRDAQISHPVKMLGVKGLAESCEKGGLKCGQSKWKDEVDLDDDGQPISASKKLPAKVLR
jgi:hypothetical protein